MTDTQDELMFGATQYELVSEFREKFGIDYHGPVRQLPGDVYELQVKRLYEELREYQDASHANDRAGQLDALVDLIYIALGTAELHGFDRFDEAFMEVHRANLKKLRAGPNGEGSKYLNPNDIYKPPGWAAPDLNKFVK
jgi:predicted HAD superfamily Cof-like phosphohydrolase